MQRIYTLVTIAFFVLSPFWYVPLIIHDLNHPEIWNEDWPNHDARIYIPGLIVVGIFLLRLFVKAIRLDMKRWEEEKRCEKERECSPKR